MKIVHYMASIRLSDGGVVRATLDMSEALAAAGHDFTLITAHTDDVPDEWRSGGPGLPRVVGLEPPLGRGRLLKKHHLDVARDCLTGADVLHMHTPWELGNLQFARLAREAGIPYVISIHGMLDDWAMAQRPLKKRTFHAAFARRLLSGAALVHCTAESELRQSDRWFGGATGRVVPLVMDFRDYMQLPGTDAARGAFAAADTDDPIVLFLSRVHPGKGLENLLGATRTLLDEGRRLRLLVAGTGEQWYVRAIQHKAQELELGDACHFLGMVRGIEKVSLYEAADIFVLSSEHENFGLVIPEALAAGTPVIASKGVSIWPELKAGGGSIIAPETAGGIADAVRTLLDDPDRCRAMGERGRAWILEFLDKQRITGEYERMYRDAAGQPAPTAREAAA